MAGFSVWLRLALSQFIVQVTTASLYEVKVTKNVVYAQGLEDCAHGMRHDVKKTCVAKDIVLDVYEPVEAPSMRPAIVFAHGGGNTAGTKDQNVISGSAFFFAQHGYVAFNINYRLAHQHGTFPGKIASNGSLTWYPGWASGYPAVRDMKAAVRFARANANKYGIDRQTVVVSGGSAGATNAVATGVSFDSDYVSELTLEDDPTLNTTHMNESSQVQAVYSHWSSDGEIDLIQKHDPQNRSRYSNKNPPIIEFHGNKDGCIPIERAYAVQREYSRTGVLYEMHVLDGCKHGAWGYGCLHGYGNCTFKHPTADYCPIMDEIALKFLAKHLNLESPRKHFEGENSVIFSV